MWCKGAMWTQTAERGGRALASGTSWHLGTAWPMVHQPRNPVWAYLCYLCIIEGETEAPKNRLEGMHPGPGVVPIQEGRGNGQGSLAWAWRCRAPRVSGLGVIPMDQGDGREGQRGLATGRMRGARGRESRAACTPARDQGGREAGLDDSEGCALAVRVATRVRRIYRSAAAVSVTGELPNPPRQPRVPTGGPCVRAPFRPGRS